ncbi:MAG: twin-arginine translocation signal domain-containing protein, partial [Geobacter sp.]|nr:twin-arginine translocation signal domain-containing protein [Geobacter sp.]
MKKDDEFFCAGVTRRDFIKTCVTATAMMGLPFGMHAKIA